MRAKVRLITLTDVNEFVKDCIEANMEYNDKVVLTDSDNNYRTNGQSLLGALVSLEWGDTYVEYADPRTYTKLKKFIKE